MKEKSKVEQVAEHVAGLIPLYTAEGDSTEVLLENGRSFIDRRGIRSVLSALARIHSLDLSAQRGQLQQQLNHRGVVPFYLAPNRVFAAFKMRAAISGNDMVYGFIDRNYINRLSPPDKNSFFLILKNGRQIPITSSYATAAKNLDHAHNIHKLLVEPRATRPPTPEELHNAAGVLALALISDVHYIKQQLEQLTQPSPKQE
ncbi:MAG: hypothetical protein ABFD08_17775 [Syntrophomonas sp.]